jgi:signal transduction histidine kinase/DNA-binding response OmpR family regulator
MSNFSIKIKNITIILVVVFFSITATIIVQGIQDISSLRTNLVTKIESVDKLVAARSGVTIEFGDKEHGQEVLYTLDAIPEVIAAAIFDTDGEEFASFKIDPDASFDPAKKLKAKFQFQGNYLYLTENIKDQDGAQLGLLCVVASTENLERQIFSYLMFSLILLVVIFLVAGVLGAWLSKSLTGPILNLAKTAERISTAGDYSIRVNKASNDEIGTLYDSFNEMLDQIAARDQEIRQLNEGLEDKVQERTRDLVKAKEQAEKARRSAELADRAKSTFLANMSHEIRTPMNAILGYSSLLMKLVTDPKQHEYLGIVQTSGKNLLALINDILDLSKIESGKFDLVYKPMNPKRIFDEIKDIFKIKTEEKGIDFIIDVDPEIPVGLLMDETRLRQILFNVVGNAVKFTNEGYVKLSVIKKMSHRDTSKVMLVFQVEDTGIGIPKEQIDVIFQAFEQQKDLGNQYGGTGLGLAITKRLVEIMNGEISVTSEEGKGSTFSVQLRDIEISSLVSTQYPVLTNIDKGLHFEGVKVLLVEDNLYNLKLVQAMLEEKKIQVEGASNGEEALETLRQFTPDLILMDMKMYGMDGYKATKIIKSDPQLKSIPVIALTADAMKEGKKKTKKAGCDGFLSKPIDENRLFAELMKHLPYQQEESPDLSPGAGKSELDIEAVGLSRLAPEALAEMLEILSTQLMEQWRQMGDSMLLDDWVQFGNKVMALGEKYNAGFIVDYGRHIIENVEHLNIAVLKKTIKNFPNIVEVLKGVKNDPEQ